MSGNPNAFREMIANMSHGGKVAMLGIPSPTEMSIDWHHVIFNQLTLRGIYGREMYETWYKMTVMLQSGLKIDQVITHRYNWKDFEQGFQAMRTGSSGKVILDWSDVGIAAKHLINNGYRRTSYSQQDHGSHPGPRDLNRGGVRGIGP